MSERAFKGVWIPAEVWLSDELTIYEKAVFAEIDSLDGENHCWASNEYLAEFCKMSVPTISRAISKLIQLGYIEKLSFDGRQRVLAVNKNISQIRETYLTDKSEISPSENLLLIENKKENNIKSTGTGALVKHPRNFSKQTLTDDLQSGKDIDEHKKEKTKSPKDRFKDECLDIIEKEYSDETKDLLIEYFEFVTSVPENKDNLCKRVKTVKQWRHKLDRLDDLVKEGYDCKKIIQQSLEKKQYVFYPLQSVQRNSKTYGNTIDNSILKGQTLSAEEAEALLAKETEEYGTI